MSFSRGNNNEFIFNKNMNIGTLISKNKFELKNAEFLVQTIQKGVKVTLDNGIMKISGSVGEDVRIDLKNNSTIQINKAYMENIYCSEKDPLFNNVDGSTDVIISNIRLEDLPFYNAHLEILREPNRFSKYMNIKSIGDGGSVGTFIFSNPGNGKSSGPSKWKTPANKNHDYHPYSSGSSSSSSSTNHIYNPSGSHIKQIGDNYGQQNNTNPPPVKHFFVNKGAFVTSLGDNNTTEGVFGKFSFVSNGDKITLTNKVTNESITKIGKEIKFLKDEKFDIDNNVFDWEDLKLAATLEASAKPAYKS